MLIIADEVYQNNIYT